MKAAKFVCVICGAEYELQEVYRCKKDNGELSIVYDYEGIGKSDEFLSHWQRAGSLWDRFRAILPQSDLSKIVSLGEGSTPLIKADRLAEKLGLKNVYLKLELCNPTGSFKDRQMTVAVSKANEWGKKDFGTVSSGNVGIALSAYCAKKGFNANVWVADNVSPTKMQQIQIYGAKLFLFPNAEEHGVEFYKIFFNSMQEFCFKEGLVPMISARPINPYMVEGSKTISFEIVSELGHVPERVFTPIGGGGLYSGLWKGFKELQMMHIIDHLPVIDGVQATGDHESIKTLKDTGINRVNMFQPLDGIWANESLEESGGNYYEVKSVEDNEAQKLLASSEGVFAEPIGTRAIVGLVKAAKSGKLANVNEIVCVITGNGLKDMSAAASILTDSKLYPGVDKIKTFSECVVKLKKS